MCIPVRSLLQVRLLDAIQIKRLYIGNSFQVFNKMRKSGGKYVFAIMTSVFSSLMLHIKLDNNVIIRVSNGSHHHGEFI